MCRLFVQVFFKYFTLKRPINILRCAKCFFFFRLQFLFRCRFLLCIFIYFWNLFFIFLFLFHLQIIFFSFFFLSVFNKVKTLRFLWVSLAVAFAFQSSTFFFFCSLRVFQYLQPPRMPVALRHDQPSCRIFNVYLLPQKQQLIGIVNILHI